MLEQKKEILLNSQKVIFKKRKFNWKIWKGIRKTQRNQEFLKVFKA